MSDFEWDSMENVESMAIEQVAAVAIYTIPGGDIAIRQKGNMGEDALVCFPRAHAQAMIDGILRAVQEEPF